MSGAVDRLTATLGDRFHIERELGGGGMSRVRIDAARAFVREGHAVRPDMSFALGIW